MKFAAILVSIVFGCSVAFAQADIRNVDFNNFTYLPSCAGEEGTAQQKVTVKNGEFSSEKKMDDYVDRFYFKVYNIIYGDVTGDKKDDAVMLSVCNTGGTGNFTEGFVYSLRGDKPVLVARIPGGDRADGGLRAVTIENGLIVIEANDGDRNSGACCPEGTITQKVRVSGGKLLTVGTPVKRDLFPLQKVTFQKGTSGTTLKLTLPGGEGVRLSLVARAGQMLSVSTSTDKVTARLLEEDDATVTDDVSGISAKLAKNGTYTIQLTNYEEGPVDVTVNIKIW
ncbi:MAG: hypothetical protein JO053_03475 [Acidobacteria bacterium]|nr:hypothetical protein [Acidobacteriota bacterium]